MQQAAKEGAASKSADAASEGLRARLGRFAVAVVVVLIATLIPFSPLLRNAQGLTVDLLHWLRHVSGQSIDQPPSKAVILGIDEETYKRPPFSGIPNVMWTPQMAAVFDKMLANGVAVIGFDIVFPTSIEEFSRDGERPLAGYERPFLRTLLRGGRQQGKIVLGYVQHQGTPLFPHQGQERIVGGRDNIRSLNAYDDDDGVIRRVPLGFDREPGAKLEPSFSVELASRALGFDPLVAQGPDPMFGDRPVLTDGKGNVLLNFDTRPGAVPVYSLADMNACVEKGDDAYFERHFKDKVVILAVVTELEDRKFTSKRFATTPEGENLPTRCAFPVMEDLYSAGISRDQISGVYIHATAINNIVHGTALRLVPSGAAIAITAAMGALAVTAALLLAPGPSLAAALALSVAWVIASTVAFGQALVLPFIEALIAVAVAFLLILLFRISFGDRDRRKIQKAFSLYLPQALVDKMAETGTMPALGGETRTVSILFSDLAAFTKISEGVEPDVLVAWLNDYFGAMTDIIEEHGGFVDKFIGDAILAVFGAPLDDPNHAANAVKAALKMKALLADPNGPLAGGALGTPKCRIGINSGPVLIGNIGSARRFNYTVIGDAVNLASRLEGANKGYGTQVLVSEDTFKLCGGDVAFRELDTVRVVGRSAPVSLFTPVSPEELVDPEASSVRQVYALALSAWRAGQFETAIERFKTTAHTDGAAAAFLKRAKAFANVPKPPSWNGVTDLTEK